MADAWDDDWETVADKEEEQAKQAGPILSKSQLRAKHVELNKRIWDSAENPERQWYAEANASAAIQPTFQPRVTMLARKPARQILSRSAAGMMSVEGEEDSEEERQKRVAADFEDRRARAQLERAEKERKYAEARERIFGSSPASSAPDNSRSHSPARRARGRGRGRGGGARDTQPRSSKEQSPTRTSAASARPLFDPWYTTKREAGESRPATPSGPERPIRQPQGPAGDGARGFGPRGLGSSSGS